MAEETPQKTREVLLAAAKKQKPAKLLTVRAGDLVHALEDVTKNTSPATPASGSK